MKMNDQAEVNDESRAEGQDLLNEVVYPHDLLMASGAMNFTVLGLNDIYVMRLEQVLLFIDKINKLNRQ